MQVALAVVGGALVALALVDMIWTTVAVSAGAGPVTSTVSHHLWEGLRRLARRRERPHRFLRLGGVLVVVVVFTLWLGFLVLGWGLVFNATDAAVVRTPTGDPASFTERLYFAGYTTATLGNGGFSPGPGLWRLLTVFASFSGLGVATMGITYLVPVTQAVATRRVTALRISGLGETPQGILVNAWEGGGWHQLEDELRSLSSEVTSLGQSHLAYPVLHYFHDVSESAAGAVKIACLDEALTLARFGVVEEHRPHGLVVRSSRDAVGSLLSALAAGHITAAEEAPPVPDLSCLREAGIPTVSDEELAEACRELDLRRRLLRSFVEDDGWDWPDVCRAESHDETAETSDAVDPHETTAGDELPAA